MSNYVYDMDLRSSLSAETYSQMTARMSEKTRLQIINQRLAFRRPIVATPAEIWMCDLSATCGDAGLALYRYKNRSLVVRRYKYFVDQAPGMAHVDCIVCTSSVHELDNANRIYSFPPDIDHPIRKHIGSCLQWEELDSQASTLLFTDLEELPVVIDRALELGIL